MFYGRDNSNSVGMLSGAGTSTQINVPGVGAVDPANPLTNKVLAKVVEDVTRRKYLEQFGPELAAQTGLDFRVLSVKLLRLRAWFLLQDAYQAAAAEEPVNVGTWKQICESAAIPFTHLPDYSDSNQPWKKLVEEIRRIPALITEACYYERLINSATYTAEGINKEITTADLKASFNFPLRVRDFKTRKILASPVLGSYYGLFWENTDFLQPGEFEGVLNVYTSPGKKTLTMFANPNNIPNLGWMVNFLDTDGASSVKAFVDNLPAFVRRMQRKLDELGVRGRAIPNANGKVGWETNNNYWKSFSPASTKLPGPAGAVGSRASPKSAPTFRKVAWEAENLLPYRLRSFTHLLDSAASFLGDSWDSKAKFSLKFQKFMQNKAAQVAATYNNTAPQNGNDFQKWLAKADTARESILNTLGKLVGGGKSGDEVVVCDKGQWTRGPDCVWSLQPKGLSSSEFQAIYGALFIEQGAGPIWSGAEEALASMKTYRQWLAGQKVTVTAAVSKWNALMLFDPGPLFSEKTFLYSADSGGPSKSAQTKNLPLGDMDLLYARIKPLSDSGLLWKRREALVKAVSDYNALPQTFGKATEIADAGWRSWCLARGAVEAQALLLEKLGEFAALRTELLQQYMDKLDALTMQLYGCHLPPPPANVAPGDWQAWMAAQLAAFQANPAPGSLYAKLKQKQAELESLKKETYVSGGKRTPDAQKRIAQLESELARLEEEVDTRMGGMNGLREDVARRRGGENRKSGSIYGTAEVAIRTAKELAALAKKSVTIVDSKGSKVEVGVGVSEAGAQKVKAAGISIEAAVFKANEAGAQSNAVGAANKTTFEQEGLGQGAGGVASIERTIAATNVNLPPPTQTSGGSLWLWVMGAAAAVAAYKNKG